MNVLFVCTHGVDRSQMAAALYNTLVTDGRADAVGTQPLEPGKTIGELAKHRKEAWNVLHVMNEDGVDLWHRKTRKLTRNMLDDYDWIIVMAQPDTIPQYLHDYPRAVYWEMPTPYLGGIDETREVRDEMKRHIVTLLASIRQQA
jgi:protein-tyrosine-phosphatase